MGFSKKINQTVQQFSIHSFERHRGHDLHFADSLSLILNAPIFQSSAKKWKKKSW
jgi:hypothetical protein